MQYRQSKKLFLSLSLLVLVSIVLAACGGEPNTTVTSAVTPINEVAQAAPTATEPPATIAPTDTPEQPTDTPMPVATEAPLATDTAPPPTDTALPPTDTPEPAPAVVNAFGQTEEGLYFRGNPAAAVTVIDYSDFL